MQFRNFLLILVVSCLFASSVQASDAKNVLVTIKPLHSLVSAVMGETGKAELLLTGATSPHDFQLKPSQMRQLQAADFVFYVDDSFESFLVNGFEVMPDDVQKLAVAQQANLNLFAIREGGAWETHGHDHHGHGEHHETQDDMHVWLSPENARRIIKFITKELSAAQPQHRDIYKKNARDYIAIIDALDTDLKTMLAPVQNKPFIVFHDAYQYFEKTYGLRAVGSITFEPNESPSPKRIQAVQHKLKETGAQCVFREPQFSDRLINTVVEGADAKRGVLDPLGAGLQDGAELYINLLRAMGAGLKECLG